MGVAKIRNLARTRVWAQGEAGVGEAGGGGWGGAKGGGAVGGWGVSDSLTPCRHHIRYATARAYYDPWCFLILRDVVHVP